MPARLSQCWVHRSRSACVASVGLDELALRRIHGSRFRRSQALNLTAALLGLWQYRPRRVAITWQGGSFDGEIMFAAVTNTRSYGGGFRVSPDARLDDGQLDLCIVPAMAKARLLWHFPRILRGTHGALPGVILSQSPWVTLRSADRDGSELPLCIDGELPSTARRSACTVSRADCWCWTVVRSHCADCAHPRQGGPPSEPTHFPEPRVRRPYRRGWRRGAALALALVSRYDLRVAVIDRRGGPGNINRGDSLLPAVTAALRDFGALPALLAAGARPLQKMQVFHPQHGRLLEAPLAAAIAADNFGQPCILVLAHPEIERACSTPLRTVAETGAGRRALSLPSARPAAKGDRQRGRVIGAVVQTTEGEQCLRARLVVAADGAASTVRSLLQLAPPTQPYDHGYYIIERQRPPSTNAMRIELHPAGGILVVPQGTDRLGLGVLVRRRARPVSRWTAAAQARRDCCALTAVAILGTARGPCCP